MAQTPIPCEELKEPGDDGYEGDSCLGEEEEDDDLEVEGWEDWKTEEEESEPDYLCLFCDFKFDSSKGMFDHCSIIHSFDFKKIKTDLGLDFYCSFKLINYVRAQVAENRCWSCGLAFLCNKDLQNHLHVAVGFGKDGKFIWDEDIYLKPFLEDDAILHSFSDDEDEEDDYTATLDKEELMNELMKGKDISEICIDNENLLDFASPSIDALNENGKKLGCVANKFLNSPNNLENKVLTDGLATKEGLGASDKKQTNRQPRNSFATVVAREIKNVNENYFGAYGSFGIHREMISDTVRMDAYRGALLNNPSLMKQATILDVGCGTGILSLFAAQAGALRIIAVEASEKMASVATQIAKDNGLLLIDCQNGEVKQCSGVINVVHGMVEELDKLIQVPPHSIDVLVSEWMGYCLLYESMLSSVLYARDHWLRPGGAILPDTATIFVAGFGRGGTSIPFWENVYGFNMSCIGKEVVEDAARLPIVDVVDSNDLLTDAVVLQSFDLATMKPECVDFTASVELELRSDLPGDSIHAKSGGTWCHGVVLWFETGFTSRFCKEMPTVLSTSPYTPTTHWNQTIFTFQEPIALASEKPSVNVTAAVGTEDNPAVRIGSRISIARSSVHHRSIDISLEMTGVSADGRKRSWPAQIFNL